VKRPHSLFAACILLLLGLLLLTPAALADDVYSSRTLAIATQLRCPICAGESVAASQTEIAKQMRDLIETKVQAGESNQQILDFFVARYGDSILMEPPKSGFSLGLWWMPVVVVVVGALVVGLFLRDRTRRTPLVQSAPVEPTDPELEAIAREVLGDDQSGQGHERATPA
jgi:cytochrome c-type biogenesis protein CcmH